LRRPVLKTSTWRGFWTAWTARNHWARRGTRPSAPHDQRTASTYIFGAICPGEGKGAAPVLPACNTEAMNLHLAEIANEVAPGKHAVLVLDQAAPTKMPGAVSALD